MTTDSLRVYWQPGCSSCLQAKEFLKRLGIPYESVNVRADPTAMADLTARGIRTVPVVTRGDEVCLAQDLDELAAFVGDTAARDRLPLDVLYARLANLVATAIEQVRALPEAALETPLPGRENRRIVDLAYHLFVIVQAYLETCQGGRLDYEYYERLPDSTMRSAAAIAAFGERVAGELAVAREAATPAAADRPLDTYYGRQPLAAVLERSCWHLAQHCRQLESLLDQLGAPCPRRFGDEALAGLPLPEAVWDDEVDMQLTRSEP